MPLILRNFIKKTREKTSSCVFVSNVIHGGNLPSRFAFIIMLKNYLEIIL